MMQSQKAITIWFTGLSGSGKSTLANGLKNILDKLGYISICLDGDETRNGINKDLGFSDKDREENIRRVAEIAKMINDQGVIVLASFITPFNSLRKLAKTIIGEDKFVLVYVNSSYETCLKRDTKGLYKKALNMEINNFTGVSSEFETPKDFSVIIDSQKLEINESLEHLLKQLIPKF